MASTYPGSLDSLATGMSASTTLDDATYPHATQHQQLAFAINALQSTLGVTGSFNFHKLDTAATLTAKLTFAAPTLTGASMRLQAGTAPTSNIAIGDLWVAGTSLQFATTTAVGGFKTVLWNDFSNTPTNFTLSLGTGTITATTFTGSGSGLTGIPNSATTATSANTASAIVARDASGNFTAGTITATTFSGAISGSGASLTTGTVPLAALSTTANGNITTTGTLTGGTLTSTGAISAVTNIIETGASPAINTGNNYTVPATGKNFIMNNNTSVTITLPTATAGREIRVINVTAQTLTSASSNVYPKGSRTLGTAVLPATIGAWAILVADGTNWVTMASGT